jgi:hypothetical protein
MSILAPHFTTTKVIDTLFVDGMKFDIREVEKCIMDEVSVNKKQRFFLCLEDKIIGFESSLGFFAETGESRWDFFCHTKQVCKDMVNEFDKMIEDRKKWSNKGDAFKHRVKSIDEKIRSKFGI